MDNLVVNVPAAACDRGPRQSVLQRNNLAFLFDDRCWTRANVRSFYRMLADSPPQWILTYPEEAAPRTGDGLFPKDVVEVVQV